MLSGVSWKDKFPTSTNTATLRLGFRAKVDAFIAALRFAGARVSCSALSICASLTSFSVEAQAPMLGLVDGDSSGATLYAPSDVAVPALIKTVDVFAGSACCFRVEGAAEKAGNIPVSDDLRPSQTFVSHTLRWIGPGPKPAPSVAAAFPKGTVVRKNAEGRYAIRYKSGIYGLSMCTSSEGLRTTLTPARTDGHFRQASEPEPIVSWYYFLGYDIEATCP